MHPKISVIISAYNASLYIEEAVMSIIEQSFKDFELLVMNDGSKDDTLEKLYEIQKKLKDDRLKIFDQTNQGLIFSLNKLISLSKGGYILRMDADDISLAERLEKQVKFLDENKDYILAGTQAVFIDKEGKEFGDFLVPKTNEEIRKKFIFHNPFIHPSVMFRKNTLSEIVYKKSFKHAEDYELWSRLLFLGKVANLDEVLLKYRVLDTGITKQNNFKMKFMGLKIRIIYISRLTASLFHKKINSK
jgi:glycosyltransferase involved in cell wall biosynthesis